MNFEQMIFDTHAHYDDAAFDEDRETLLASFPGNGIGAVIDAASTVSSIREVLVLAEKWPFVYGAVGVHPDEIRDLDETVFAEISALCDHGKVAAVGEIGLDYHWNSGNKPEQRDWFARFIDLGRRRQLPLIIHSRDAAADTLDVVRSNRAGDVGAVMHCYSYSRELAKEYLDMGLYFGIGGVATFKNARKLVETMEYLPMDAILLETDCPYLAPVPFRGKRNCSLYLPYVVKRISEIKNLPEEEVIRVTNANARRLFTKTRALCAAEVQSGPADLHE